jgi:hypothetical protein
MSRQRASIVPLLRLRHLLVFFLVMVWGGFQGTAQASPEAWATAAESDLSHAQCESRDSTTRTSAHYEQSHPTRSAAELSAVEPESRAGETGLTAATLTDITFSLALPCRLRERAPNIELVAWRTHALTFSALPRGPPSIA